MQPFKYTRAADAGAAVAAVFGSGDAKFIAGGTNLLDLMKEGVTNVSELVDIAGLNLTQIRSTATGISLGALAKNTDTANHPLVRRDYPLLTQAILAGASAQIRNMATNGGNLLQRTRCSYFYDVSMPCNKRKPGSGCGAIEGINRTHAILGWSDKCVAVHPSDMAVALAALNATVNVKGKDGGTRAIPFPAFHRLPGDTPEKDNTLEHGELITSIEIPKNLFNRSYYLKVRDRASYAFALISVAVAMETKGGIINGEPRIAMGGVAHKPWRAMQAEKYLAGKKATEENFTAAASAEMAAAKPLEHNKFKVELGKRAIVHALMRATGIV
ncbi:MAG: xanthine dehydrogenase family protein subunit M [Acidobacteriota bacterium]